MESGCVVQTKHIHTHTHTPQTAAGLALLYKKTLSLMSARWRHEHIYQEVILKNHYKTIPPPPPTPQKKKKNLEDICATSVSEKQST